MKAAESAKQARTAEAGAQRAARDAQVSAALATNSADAARSSANGAWAAANQARASAEAAGKDKDAASKAATEAMTAYLDMKAKEDAAQRQNEEDQRDLEEINRLREELMAQEGEIDWAQFAKDGGHLLLDAAGSTNIPIISNAANAGNCGWYAAEKQYVDAATSCIGIAPGAGVTNGAKAAKGGKKIWGFLKKAFSGRKKWAEPCRVPNSFTPETQVRMADGFTKPIKDVRTGEKVLATDPVSGRTEARSVDDVIVGSGQKHLVRLTVDTDGDQGEATGTMTATEGHPFWLEDQQSWVDAGDIQPGALLRTSAGTWVKVTATEAWTQEQQVYNLTVNGIHTYYVSAGPASVLVHNADKCDWVAEFNELPNGENSGVKQLPTEVEIRAKFDRWTEGAKRIQGSGDKIPDRFIFEDGTMMQWRIESDSGGATLDVFPAGNKKRKKKVHTPRK